MFLSTGANVSLSAIDCKEDRLSFYPNDHGHCRLRGYFGSSVTMWQLFTVSLPLESGCNETTVSCNLVSFSAEWTRTVHSLGLSEHTSPITCSVQSVTESSCKLAVNASLTLHNVQYSPDTDTYSVSLSLKNCPNLPPEPAGNFVLDVTDHVCVELLPQPTVLKLNYTFYESPQCPLMNVTFVGGKAVDVIVFEWRNAANDLLCFTGGGTNRIGTSRYVCGWRTNDIATCNSTIWLSIGNCSTSDAGNYTVFGGNGNENGSTAHVKLCKHTPVTSIFIVHIPHKRNSVSIVVYSIHL